MDKSKIWMLEGAAIGVAVVLAIIFISRGVEPDLKTETPKNTNNVNGESTSEEIKYSAEVPKNATSSVPVESAPVGQGGDSQLNFFSLVASKKGFNPTSITVKKGNLAQLRFTAQDGDYDFFLPATALYHSVKMGETKQILIQLTDSGTFVFECRDFCPDSGKISGQLIVLPE
jgi:heme/copper-type cytochrome/quinol oxidase subunit 2